MKKFAIQVVLLLIVIAVSLVFFSPTGQSPKIDLPFLPQAKVIKKLQINDYQFKVEIADTDQKRKKGLGGRESLASDEGMLFVFKRSDRYPFWMKGLKFPLDFIWIKGDQIVGILPKILPPLPEQKDESIPVFTSEKEVDKVLEVNAGTVERLKLKEGDTVKIIN